VRKTPRLATAGLLAVTAMVVAMAVSACGGSVSDSALPSEAAVPAPAPGNGVTTPDQAFGPICSQLPQNGIPGSPITMAGRPVATAAATNPLLKLLTVAIRKAGVADTLNSAPAATVFAPYDAAFTDLQQSIGPDKFNALLANSGALADILKYHVVVKRYDRAGLVAAGTVATLQGGTVKIKNDGDTMDITDNAGKTAHVLCGNLPTGNATVFVIDKVLMPQQN
jgi:uncharacterized surface protein with fasciclin (FAS1) repeats